MSIIDSEHRSGVDNKNEDVAPSEAYLAAVDPVHEQRVAEAKANIEARQDAILSHPESEGALYDWDENRKRVDAKDLTKKEAADWVASYLEWKNGDITQEQLDKDQAGIESGHEAGPGETKRLASGDGKPTGAKEPGDKLPSAKSSAAAKDTGNPIEQRAADLRPKLSSTDARGLDKFVKRYADGDITLDRLKSELDNYEGKAAEEKAIADGERADTTGDLTHEQKLAHIEAEHPAFLHDTEVTTKTLEDGKWVTTAEPAEKAVSALKQDVSDLTEFLKCIRS